MVYTLIGILLKQQQGNEANSMTDKEQRRVIRFRKEGDRRLNEEPHDPERRVKQERRDQTDRRESTS